MKTLLGLAALPLLLPLLAPTEIKLEYRPDKDKPVTKTFEQHFEAETKSFTLKVGGREAPPEMTPPMELTMEVTGQQEFVDTCDGVADGRPTRLARRFVKAVSEHSSEFAMADQEPEVEKKARESKLTGQTVAFEWDAKAEEYKKSFVGDEGDAELLEKLEEDADLRVLLPSGAVEEGKSWEVDVQKCMDALAPGGSNGIPRDEDDKDEEDPFDNLEGEAKVTLKEVREVDGRKLAVLIVEVEAQGSAPMTTKDGMEGELGLKVDLEGEVLWDLAAGRPSSFEVGGTVDFTVTLKQELEAGGSSHSMEMIFALAGQAKLTGEYDG